ncbi:ATP-binding protein [Poritiphilus flavus]|uniref:histidine kinase n=1 Tax=Poritiphilus flavus TaxID=2697053 RepID=A0A6L9EEK0_9FLAO|nr:ATP-binding protein [Poritiphilus flavus]NAS13194.1 response regulator [Poritiphilus flavus]
MKSKNLLTQLSDLEQALNNFSFEELSAAEATRLKKSFTFFKDQLENRIWGSPSDEIQPGGQIREENGADNSGKLIATVSHEMRTPLNGIIGFTELLREGELSADQLNHVDAIRSASQTLMGIINELLEYSKLSAELHRSESVNFNLKSVVNEVTYLCKTLILEKEVDLSLNTDPNIPDILKGDPSKLTQVLLNLLGNAIKFVEQGSIFLRLELEKTVEDTFWIRFIIKDTGIGIAKEDLRHIFDSFRQAKEDTFSKYGGSGLGLSIVKQVIEQQKGSIEVESEVGVGTTFSFTLPFKSGQLSRKEVSPNKGELPEWLKGMHILVFEDNPLNQRLIGSRLKAWGCKYYITENALQGLAILENNPIEMVLMDLRMPVMSGYEVTAKIRSNPKPTINKIPIIALTADFTVEDQSDCKETGIDDYLLKPYSPAELLSKLKQNRKDMSNYIEVTSTEIGTSEGTRKLKYDIDLESVLEECMGETSLLEELVSLYKQNALEFIGEVKIKLGEEDLESVSFAAHKIKSGLKMIGTPELLSIVEQIHKDSKENGDIKHLEFLHSCFVEEYPRVEEALDNAMRKLKK